MLLLSINKDMFSGMRFFLKNIHLVFSTFLVNLLSLSQTFTLSNSLLIAISLKVCVYTVNQNAYKLYEQYSILVKYFKNVRGQCQNYLIFICMSEM